MKYEVWIEGYVATGESAVAHRLESIDGKYLWEGETFNDACIEAMKGCNLPMPFYDKERNAFWGCRFFDNEKDAKESFG